MSDKLKIGLAGTGDIGRLHARALQKRPDVELCVCAGSTPAKAESFAREFGATFYQNYAVMLADSAIAGVDICVPNDLHRSYVEQALAAGKAVLCEKPIAMTMADAEAMREAANRAEALLMIGHILRFWPEYVKMREVLLSGVLGRCLTITMRRMLSLYISVAGEQGWRRSPDRMGGALLDLQIHDLDFLHWTFGMPREAYCAAAASADGNLNHVYTTLKFQQGPVAMAESSFLLQGDPMIFAAKAVCERGTLDYALNLEHFSMHTMAGAASDQNAARFAATLVQYQADREPAPLVYQDTDILDAVFGRELSYFVDCVAGRTNNLLAVEDSMAALRMALACKDSALSGRVVELN
ncbi:MAG: Gfo/Idh/MocA family oxidoreductase [Acidobacteriaceae bacterium]|nr:Gfo/Idh/MocA family oxidoreductase [Acidobacteriaceae bacterium]